MAFGKTTKEGRRWVRSTRIEPLNCQHWLLGAAPMPYTERNDHLMRIPRWACAQFQYIAMY
jgi:hypothetical protein